MEQFNPFIMNPTDLQTIHPLLSKMYHVPDAILQGVVPAMGPVRNAPANDARTTRWCPIVHKATSTEESAPVILHDEWYPLYWNRHEGEYGTSIQVQDGHERLMASHPGRYCLPPQATSLLMEFHRLADLCNLPMPYYWNMEVNILCDEDDEAYLKRYGTDDAVTLVFGRLETDTDGYAAFTPESKSLSLGSLTDVTTALGFRYHDGQVSVIQPSGVVVAQVKVDPTDSFFVTMRPCYYWGHTTTAIECHLSAIDVQESSS